MSYSDAGASPVNNLEADLKAFYRINMLSAGLISTTHSAAYHPAAAALRFDTHHVY